MGTDSLRKLQLGDPRLDRVHRLEGPLDLLLALAHDNTGIHMVGPIHYSEAAVALAMIGFLGTIRVLPSFLTIIGGGSVERPGAIIAQLTMACCCFVLVLFGVRSFVEARRKREA